MNRTFSPCNREVIAPKNGMGFAALEDAKLAWQFYLGLVEEAENNTIWKAENDA